jgi:hypothetical protein
MLPPLTFRVFSFAGAIAAMALAASPALAQPHPDCSERVAGVTNQITVARAEYAKRSAELFQAYNTKIKSDLLAANEKYFPQMSGPGAKERSKEVTAQFTAERKQISEQWVVYGREKRRLHAEHAAELKELSLERDQIQRICKEGDIRYLSLGIRG